MKKETTIKDLLEGHVLISNDKISTMFSNDCPMDIHEIIDGEISVTSVHLSTLMERYREYLTAKFQKIISNKNNINPVVTNFEQHLQNECGTGYPLRDMLDNLEDNLILESIESYTESKRRQLLVEFMNHVNNWNANEPVISEKDVDHFIDN